MDYVGNDGGLNDTESFYGGLNVGNRHPTTDCVAQLYAHVECAGAKRDTYVILACRMGGKLAGVVMSSMWASVPPLSIRV